MAIERLPDNKKGKIQTWNEMSLLLPEDINPHHEDFLVGYFKAQQFIRNGRKTKARRVFEGLEKTTGYKEYEAENQEILALIDLAVRGQTNRRLYGRVRF